MAFKLFLGIKIFLKVIFFCVFLVGFYCVVYGFAMPQSFHVLQTSLVAYPIYTDETTDNKNFEILGSCVQ